MRWFDYHLWEFTIGKQKYSPPLDEDWGSRPRLLARKVRLREVLQPRKTIIDYTYDFGDHWKVDSPSPISARVSRASSIRATLAARYSGTRRP